MLIAKPLIGSTIACKYLGQDSFNGGTDEETGSFDNRFKFTGSRRNIRISRRSNAPTAQIQVRT